MSIVRSSNCFGMPFFFTRLHFLFLEAFLLLKHTRWTLSDDKQNNNQKHDPESAYIVKRIKGFFSTKKT